MKSSSPAWSLVLLLSCGVCLADHQTPVVAILSEPGLRNEAALLTAALGKESAPKLVEREQVDKILNEQKLAAAGLTRAESVRLGKLVKANGLSILQRIEVNGKARMSLRLVAVDPGVIVSDEQYSAELISGAGIANVILPRLKPLWPKLTASTDSAIPISVAGIHAPVDTAAFKELERELTLLLIHRLTQEPELFVLERRKMEALTTEKDLTRSDSVSAFLTGRCLAEGSFVENGNQLAVTLRPGEIGEALGSPRGRTPDFHVEAVGNLQRDGFHRNIGGNTGRSAPSTSGAMHPHLKA